MEKQFENDDELLKQAYITIKNLKNQLKNINNFHEPIAIVGIGCRSPGGVKNHKDLWNLLISNSDAISEIPPDRWDKDMLYDPEEGKKGKINTKYGGFLDDVYHFDPAFFNLSPREVRSLDPQQRLLLEVSWEALEDANIVPLSLQNSKTGVFIGISSNDYRLIVLDSGGYEAIDSYYSSGNSGSVASGRLSFFYGLKGPSISIDTACSSSLVSIHLACQSLRKGECDLVIAGGVNLILSPEESINFSMAKMLSIDGRCKAFDNGANGYVRSEGCGVLILKRLRDVMESDNVYAVIKGTAINHDGPSSGLTVPNGKAQEEVITSALKNSDCLADEVSYIEAHGTGTPLGDPIEISALNKVYNHLGTRISPLLVGTIKTNIGHCEAAAGIMGVIKTALCLQKQIIPANLHFKVPNANINWENNFIQVPTKTIIWSNLKRIAGISSFGFSGTNAHVIIESVKPKKYAYFSASPSQFVLILSAKNDMSLQKLAIKYLEYIKKSPELRLEDICYTANAHRMSFTRQLVINTHSLEDLQNQLTHFINDNPCQSTHKIDISSPNSLLQDKNILLMLRDVTELSEITQIVHYFYETHELYRQYISKYNEILSNRLGISLVDNGDLNFFYSNLAEKKSKIFFYYLGLVETYLGWLQINSIILAFGIGECIAAYLAGIIDIASALDLVILMTKPDCQQSDLLFIEKLVINHPKLEIYFNNNYRIRSENIKKYWSSIILNSNKENKKNILQNNFIERCSLFLIFFHHIDDDSDENRLYFKENEKYFQIGSIISDHFHEVNFLIRLIKQGISINWKGYYPNSQLIALPTYAFSKSRYFQKKSLTYFILRLIYLKKIILKN